MSEKATKSRRHVYFMVKEPGAPDRILILDTQELTIGRSNDSDLQAKYEDVSRRQAVIKRDGQSYLVQNMSASSSTIVNGDQIQQHTLSNGDAIRISELEITFVESTENPATVGPKLEYASQLKDFAPGRIQGDNPEATTLGPAPAEEARDGGGFEVRPAGEFGYGADGSSGVSPEPRNLDLELDDFGLHETTEPVDMSLEALSPTANSVSQEPPVVEAGPPVAKTNPPVAKTNPPPPVAKTKSPVAKTTPPVAKTKSPVAKTKPPVAKTTPPVAKTKPPVARAKRKAPDEAWTLDEEDSAPKASASTLSLTLEIEGLTPDLQKTVGSLIGKIISLPSLKIRLKDQDLG
jgi:predicted component of type VI protein secretion system